MFSVAKDFKAMLGNVRRDPATGRVVGAGVTQIVLYGKMNATEVHLNKSQEERNVLGDQVTFQFCLYKFMKQKSYFNDF